MEISTNQPAANSDDAVGLATTISYYEVDISSIGRHLHMLMAIYVVQEQKRCFRILL